MNEVLLAQVVDTELTELNEREKHAVPTPPIKIRTRRR